ncbi:MAG: hypothetical protein AAFY73_09780 [Pseudomonadota bacterium]
MRVIVALLLAVFSLSATIVEAEARRGGSAQTIKFVSELPDLPLFNEMQIDDQRPKLGFRHERVSALGVPFAGSTKGDFVL